MALQDELREQLIKQFAADVVILTEDTGKEYYACPTCKRHVAMSNEKCPSCEQALKWDNVKKKEIEVLGSKTATLTFQVPGDFVKANCRKCPISYIGKSDGENVYECPLNMRNNCPLDIK